jgi:hypothetical protein
VSYVGLGHVGSRGGLWLGERVGGESERGLEWCLPREGSERGSGEGCCKVFLNNAQDLHESSFSFFQALKDKGERGLLQYWPTRG